MVVQMLFGKWRWRFSCFEAKLEIVETCAAEASLLDSRAVRLFLEEWEWLFCGRFVQVRPGIFTIGGDLVLYCKFWLECLSVY